MGKRVFVLDGSPIKSSFSGSLCDAYGMGANEAGHEVRNMTVSNMKFDMDLDHGYLEEKSLEPDLVKFQENLKWCDHFVLGHPLWWGTVPAKTKGLIDRAFLPGFAFSFDAATKKITKLLTNKSALVIVTSDTPDWYLKLVYRSGGFRMMKTQVFEFCGISPVRFKHFSTTMDADETQRNAWLAQAKNDGSKLPH